MSWKGGVLRALVAQVWSVVAGRGKPVLVACLLGLATAVWMAAPVYAQAAGCTVPTDVNELPLVNPDDGSYTDVAFYANYKGNTNTAGTCNPAVGTAGGYEYNSDNSYECSCGGGSGLNPGDIVQLQHGDQSVVVVCTGGSEAWGDCSGAVIANFQFRDDGTCDPGVNGCSLSATRLGTLEGCGGGGDCCAAINRWRSIASDPEAIMQVLGTPVTTPDGQTYNGLDVEGLFAYLPGETACDALAAAAQWNIDQLKRGCACKGYAAFTTQGAGGCADLSAAGLGDSGGLCLAVSRAFANQGSYNCATSRCPNLMATMAAAWGTSTSNLTTLANAMTSAAHNSTGGNWSDPVCDANQSIMNEIGASVSAQIGSDGPSRGSAECQLPACMWDGDGSDCITCEGRTDCEYGNPIAAPSFSCHQNGHVDGCLSEHDSRDKVKSLVGTKPYGGSDEAMCFRHKRTKQVAYFHRSNSDSKATVSTPDGMVPNTSQIYYYLPECYKIAREERANRMTLFAELERVGVDFEVARQAIYEQFGDAFAPVSGGTSSGQTVGSLLQVICNVMDMISGPTAQGVAVMAVLAIAIMSLYKGANWKLIITTVLAMAISLNAEEVATKITGGGLSCSGGASPEISQQQLSGLNDVLASLRDKWRNDAGPLFEQIQEVDASLGGCSMVMLGVKDDFYDDYQGFGCDETRTPNSRIEGGMPVGEAKLAHERCVDDYIQRKRDNPVIEQPANLTPDMLRRGISACYPIEMGPEAYVQLGGKPTKFSEQSQILPVQRIYEKEHLMSPRHKINSADPNDIRGDTNPDDDLEGAAPGSANRVAFASYPPQREDPRSDAEKVCYDSQPLCEREPKVIPVINDTLRSGQQRVSAFAACEKCIGVRQQGECSTGASSAAGADPVPPPAATTLRASTSGQPAYGHKGPEQFIGTEAVGSPPDERVINICQWGMYLLPDGALECGLNVTTHQQCCGFLTEDVVMDNVLPIRQHHDAISEWESDIEDPSEYRPPYETYPHFEDSTQGSPAGLNSEIDDVSFRFGDNFDGPGEIDDNDPPKGVMPYLQWFEEGKAHCAGCADIQPAIGHAKHQCLYGGWEEMKLYQARCYSFFGINCLCDYDQTFKSGSAEEYVLLRSGGFYSEFGTIREGSTLVTRSAQKYWPLSWRGYIGEPEVPKDPGAFPERNNGKNRRFPYAGGEYGTVQSAITVGLDNAVPGLIVMWTSEIVGDNRMPHVAYVEEARTKAFCEIDCQATGGDCGQCANETSDWYGIEGPYIRVSEWNYGKFPDMCGNTDRWGRETRRWIYKNRSAFTSTRPDSTRLEDYFRDDVKEYNPTLNCADPALKRCHENLWAKVELYDSKKDLRRTGYGAGGRCAAELDGLTKQQTDNDTRYTSTVVQESCNASTGVCTCVRTAPDGSCQSVIGKDISEGCDPPILMRPGITSSPAAVGSRTVTNLQVPNQQRMPDPIGSTLVTEIQESGVREAPRFGRGSGGSSSGGSSSGSSGGGGSSGGKDDECPVDNKADYHVGWTKLGSGCSTTFPEYGSSVFYSVEDVAARNVLPPSINSAKQPVDLSPRDGAACSTPNDRCTDAPFCFINDPEITSCDDKGYLRKLKDTKYPLYVEKRTDANYRNSGYSNDFVVDYLYYNLGFFDPAVNGKGEQWMRYMLENPPITWLADIEGAACWMVGPEACSTAGPDQSKRLAWMWNKYDSTDAVYEVNATVADNIQNNKTVAVMVSDEYYRGQAGIVTGYDATKQCVNMISSNWLRMGCQAYDAKNCYQIPQSFGVNCRMDCVPLNKIAMMWNPILQQVPTIPEFCAVP